MYHPVPPDFRIGTKVFQLSTGSTDWDWINNTPFLRVPGKTEPLFVYRSLHVNLPEIALLTLTGLEGESTFARKSYPWSHTAWLDANSLSLPLSSVPDHLYIQRVLEYDKITEGDSLRLFNYLVAHDYGMPTEFWPMFLLWLRDEINHCEGFTKAYNALFGYDATRERALQCEQSDFEQFTSILNDPFATLITLAYDEVSTIAGYKHDIPIYKALGESMVKFVNRVIADEGWHFSQFIKLAVKYFPSRLSEVPAILSEATRLDGRPYKRTFCLDHDPRVECQFDSALKERAVFLTSRATQRKLHGLSYSKGA